MTRRIPLLTVVAGMAIAGAIAAPAPSAQASESDDLRAALKATDSPLRTPFEKSNGARWTSFEQWLDFWSGLDAASDRVEVDRVGSSGQGRPIHAITIGHPTPPSVRTQAQGSVFMLNCSIHGDEPSGREACMILARDLATSTDPRISRFLRSTTVVMTGINPDGWVANTRGNAAGTDINRDFLKLATPEARVLAKLISERKPDVLNDLHEYGPRADYDTQALTLWPRNRNVDAGVHALAKTMVEDYVEPRLDSAGLSHGRYGQLVRDGKPYRQVAGDDQARILRNYTGLRHVVGMLTEAANEPVTQAEKDDPALLNRNRVAVQYAAVVGNAELIESERRDIAQTTTQAAERATQMGAARKGIVYFAGQDDMLPTKPEQVEANPMCGYSLSAAQASEFGEVLALHGVKTTKTADGAWVPMGQPARGLIPLLFDERSEFRITTAEPVAECPGS